MFMLGEIGKPILQTLANSEQQRSATLWHSLTAPVTSTSLNEMISL